VPRQPGLASGARGSIQFISDPDIKTALRRIEEFSHLWIIFVFHDHGGNKWKPSIRPPRLGGSEKVGVLASRSPHRPNPIGISAVKIEKVDLDAKGGPEIFVSGLDLIDGTPVLDIKPYIPYADSIADATAGWASGEIKRHPVQVSDEAESEFLKLDPKGDQQLRKLALEILELDPRPAFQKSQFPPEDPNSWGRRYGFDVLGTDIKYEIREGYFWLYAVLEMKSKPKV
jgi:tRNA-Thr(GGU) m(6)t(6)A37 methyltransferase TsaA